MPAGTVVDKGIVHPTERSFFLASHAGIQGTSRPTHYHVLYDSANLSPDVLQSFTYKCVLKNYAFCAENEQQLHGDLAGVFDAGIGFSSICLVIIVHTTCCEA